jgi:hypothetical protein
MYSNLWAQDHPGRSSAVEPDTGEFCMQPMYGHD